MHFGQGDIEALAIGLYCDFKLSRARPIDTVFEAGSDFSRSSRAAVAPQRSDPRLARGEGCPETNLPLEFEGSRYEGTIRELLRSCEDCDDG
jgi:hypothetical protein